MDNILTAQFGFKGEAGMSAYELAVKNGFEGTEQDWLATLGTSSHFDENKVLYTATSGQTVFDLPTQYTSNSFADVYKNGVKLNSSEYTINSATKKVTLTAGATANDKVEIVCLTMSTNSLPIVETLNAESTNNTAAGASVTYEGITEAKQIAAGKLDAKKIQILTGSVSNIAAGDTKIIDVAYPENFSQIDTVIIGKMVSSSNIYYDISDKTSTVDGFPIISMIALTSSSIRIWLTNTSTSLIRSGYYKIILLKVS